MPVEMRAWELPADLRSAGEARRQVRWLLSAGPWDDAVDDVALVVSELVTNAVLHAATDVTLTMIVGDDGLRVEVADTNPGPSHVEARLPPDAAGTTGRGLAVVAALARRWGVDDGPAGTTVWFELDREPADAAAPQPVLVDRTAQPPSNGERRIELLGIPTATFVADQRQQDDLYREFQLLRASAAPEPALAALAAAIVERHARVHHLGWVEATAAAAEGRDRFDLVVRLPAGAPPDDRGWLELLSEADAACQAGALVSLPAPAEVRDLRRWFVEETARQLAGESPRPCPLPAGPDVTAPPTP